VTHVNSHCTPIPPNEHAIRALVHTREGHHGSRPRPSSDTRFVHEVSTTSGSSSKSQTAITRLPACDEHDRIARESKRYGSCTPDRNRANAWSSTKCRLPRTDGSRRLNVQPILAIAYFDCGRDGEDLPASANPPSRLAAASGTPARWRWLAVTPIDRARRDLDRRSPPSLGDLAVP